MGRYAGQEQEPGQCSDESATGHEARFEPCRGEEEAARGPGAAAQREGRGQGRQTASGGGQARLAMAVQEPREQGVGAAGAPAAEARPWFQVGGTGNHSGIPPRKEQSSWVSE